MNPFTKRRAEEFVKLVDEYEKKNGRLPDGFDAGVMMREADERAKNVPSPEKITPSPQ